MSETKLKFKNKLLHILAVCILNTLVDSSFAGEWDLKKINVIIMHLVYKNLINSYSNNIN